MSEAAIRTEIVTILGSVANIGTVHSYERFIVDPAKFLELFKTTIGGVPQIRGWEIGRKGPFEDIEQRTMNQLTYSIKGYIGLQDAAATELSFSQLVEDVRTKFRDNLTLNGKANGHDGLKGEVLEVRMFGNVLCHYVEMTLTVYDHIQ